jgi:TolB-like protein
MSEEQFGFGDFILDRSRRVLMKRGKPVPVGHRGVALLEALLAAQGRVVTKAELMDIAWPGQAVEESNLSVQVAALRKSLGYAPNGEDWIATVPRIGYRLFTSEKHAPPPAVADAPPERPSIAVLPFLNLSTSRDQEFFADGMTEDIGAALSRIGELFVVSRGSSFALKGRALPAKEAARELGVRYILEGSVRPAGNSIRVTAQLIDGHSGNSVWAERYDGAAEDIFAMQDDITRNIVQAMQVRLMRGESARLWEGQTKNLKAWEKAVLGFQTFARFSKADSMRGRELLEEAVALDPKYTGALALLGVVHYWDARYTPSLDRSQALAAAEDCAARLEMLDPQLGQLRTLKSCIAFIRGHHGEAVRFGVEAAALSPGDSRAHGFLGMFQIYDGQLQAAYASLTQAIRHAPVPEPYLYYYPAIAHMWLGNLDRALGYAEENRRLEGDEPLSAAYLAAIRIFRGEMEEARRIVQTMREATPEFGIADIVYSELYREKSHLERLVSALRQAGLPG